MGGSESLGELLLERDGNVFLKARAKMLFPEAGRFEAGRVTGTSTAYELGLEINEIQDVAVNENQYLFNRIDRSDYQYPFFPKAGDR